MEIGRGCVIRVMVYMVMNIYDMLVDTSHGVTAEVFVYLIERVDCLICVFICV